MRCHQSSTGHQERTPRKGSGRRLIAPKRFFRLALPTPPLELPRPRGARRGLRPPPVTLPTVGGGGSAASVIFATKASLVPPPNVVWNAPMVVGKLVELVKPTT